jgi:hypothetical protein
VLDELEVGEAEGEQAERREDDRARDAEAELEPPELALEIAEFSVAHAQMT